MAVSEVSIANLALTALSTSRITSFDDDDENARKVSAIFDFERDALLSEHNWNFARAQSSLALLATTPTVNDYAYAFQLPVDCIRVIRSADDYDFMIVGNTLYTNDNPMIIEYIRREENPVLFSPGFCKALAYRLAASLSYGITANASLASGMAEMAEKEVKKAKQTDAQEGRGIRIIGSQLITARQQ